MLKVKYQNIIIHITITNVNVPGIQDSRLKYQKIMSVETERV